MKKFITAAMPLALAIAPAYAMPASCEFHAQAPEAHVVIAGDTLWDIAEKFLQNPWCWPNVWEQNRQSVSNPHKIYPGQTIYFDRAHGRLSQLDHKSPVALQDEKRSPRIRAEPLAGEAIPLVAPDLLALAKAMPVLDKLQMQQAARILAFSDGRSMGMQHDAIFVTGALNGEQQFLIIRPDRVGIRDPDSGIILAYAGKRVGLARLVRASAHPRQAHLFTASASSSELLTGDLLIPVNTAVNAKPLTDLPVLHASIPISARIAGIFRDGLWAQAYDMVALNRGSLHGLDAGSTLSVIRQAKISTDNKHNPDNSGAPMQTIATLLVISVTDKLAFALVMRAIEGIQIGDLVASTADHTK